METESATEKTKVDYAYSSQVKPFHPFLMASSDENEINNLEAQESEMENYEKKRDLKVQANQQKLFELFGHLKDFKIPQLGSSPTKRKPPLKKKRRKYQTERRSPRNFGKNVKYYEKEDCQLIPKVHSQSKLTTKLVLPKNTRLKLDQINCHCCKKKTKEFVICTNRYCAPKCGMLRVGFCKNCLMNRQGEDLKQAQLSKKWICPRCRGSCGKGCYTCCTCVACRKKFDLKPVGNTLNEAKKQGFSNVHDYLVHQETREECGVIQSRKLQFSWGLWMRKTYSDPEPTTESTADTLYFVEKILDKTIIDRKKYYLVKWKDFPLESATWEPVDENLISSCAPLIEAFNQSGKD